MLHLLLSVLQSIAPGSFPATAPTPPAGSPAATCQASWIPTFGPTGSLDNYVNACVVYDDGAGPDLYVGGGLFSTGATLLKGVARWTGAGFEPLGSGLTNNAAESVRALLVRDTGPLSGLYACGDFFAGGGLARWNGTTWVAVGGGLSIPNPSYPGERPWAQTAEVYDWGQGPHLYVTGHFQQAGNVAANGCAKWSGASWSAVPFAPGGADDMAVYDAGAGPELYSGGVLGVWRLGPSQTWVDVTFGATAVFQLLVLDLGTGPALHAIGTFGGVKDVARFSGSSWIPLGSQFTRVNGMGAFDDGSGLRLYVQGTLAGAGSLSAWNGTSWQLQPGTLSLTNGTAGGAASMRSFNDGSGTRLHVGGYFQLANGISANCFARFDGTTWYGDKAGVNGTVRALREFDDGTGPALFAGGEFSAIDGASHNRIAKWDGANWSNVGAGFASGRVECLETFDSGTGRALYAGGTFSAGPSPGNRVARWDGQAWTPLGTGLTGAGTPTVSAMKEFDDGSGNALFVGGRFSAAGGVPAANLAKWDGNTWSAVSTGVTAPGGSSVLALEVFDDGGGPKLYVAGVFTSAGGTNAQFIARWDGTSFAPLGSGPNNAVTALEVFDDGTGQQLYAGGSFTVAGGVAAVSMARWSGSAWSAIDNAVTPYQVWALTVFDDGSGPALFVAGGSVPGAAMLARWNGTWTTVAPGAYINGYLGMALAEFDDGTTDALYLGGVFPGSPAGDGNLARYGCPSAPPVSSFCSGDGSGTPCPCGNNGAAGSGCANSVQGAGARLAWSGSASVQSADFRLLGSGMPASAPCIYLQGTLQQAGGAGVVFGDGLLCVGGTLIRLAGKTNVGGASSFPEVGDPSIAVRGQIPPAGGVTRTYQCWYRNPANFCTPFGFNLTNALAVDWSL